MNQKQLSMDMIEVELLRNPISLKLVSVPGHSKLSIVELLERKFAFRDYLCFRTMRDCF